MTAPHHPECCDLPHAYGPCLECPECDGAGEREGHEEPGHGYAREECSLCEGRGRIPAPKPSAPMLPATGPADIDF